VQIDLFDASKESTGGQHPWLYGTLVLCTVWGEAGYFEIGETLAIEDNLGRGKLMVDALIVKARDEWKVSIKGEAVPAGYAPKWTRQEAQMRLNSFWESRGFGVNKEAENCPIHWPK